MTKSVKADVLFPQARCDLLACLVADTVTKYMEDNVNRIATPNEDH